MLADWAATGQPLDEFWDATPREVAAALRGLKHRIDAERNAAVIGGWIAAGQFAKAMAGEGIDPLADVLEWFAPRPPPRPQTANEMRGAWRCWVVATGGTLAVDPPTEPLQTEEEAR